MGSMILVELLLLALVHFWPESQKKELFRVTYEPDATAIIEAPVVTYQSGQPPPPPSPQPPVEVPDEVEVEDEKIEFLEFNDVGKANSVSFNIGNSGGVSGKIYENPEMAPSIVYIVEPTIENKTEGKALIYVSFLVDKKGNVEEATIKRILLFDDEGRPTIEVRDLNERVLSATIKAALQWKFRPGNVNGQPVRALTVQTFTIDY